LKILYPNPLQKDFFRKALIPFQEFEDYEWSLLAETLRFKSLKRKEILVQIGEISQDIYFLVEGIVRFYFEREGDLITNYFSFPGELIGSYASFITGKPSKIGIEALENSQVLILDRKQLDRLSQDPNLALKMEQMRRKIAEFMIICYEDRVLSFLTHSPEERYLHLLNSNLEVFRKIPQHYIANYLGITPVSLSRIRNRSRGITA